MDNSISLCNQFNLSSEKDRPIVEELAELSRLFQLPVQELFYKWEAFSIRNLDTSSLNAENVRLFRDNLQRQLEDTTRSSNKKFGNASRPKQSPMHPTQTPRIDSVLGISSESLKIGENSVGYDKSPDPLRNHNVDQSPLSRHKGSTKKQSDMRVISVLNPHVSGKKVTDVPRKLSIVANFETKKYDYFTMYQKLSESSEILDEMLNEFEEQILKFHNIKEIDLVNPLIVSQSEGIAVGRLITDSPNGGRPTQNAIMLETSRRIGAGGRVLLKLDDVESCTFFSGKFVAVRGKNPDGTCFIVSEILELPNMPLADIKVEQEFLKDGQLDVIVASGPYTENSNLCFEALDALIQTVEEEQPDLIILCGPFIDCDSTFSDLNKFAQYDDFTKSADFELEDIFKQLVTPRLNRIACPVFLVPSLRELAHNHLAWPQAALERKQLGLNSNIKCIPNPSLISVNHIVFGMSTADILSHMSKEEFVKNPKYSNMFDRTIHGVLNSGCFYPLLPAPWNEDTEYQKTTVNMHLPMLGLSRFENALPHFLILTSEMHHFARKVDGVISINPGPCAKPSGRGTFAHISIKPTNYSNENDRNDIFPKDCHEKFQIDDISRVEIVRI